MEWEYKIGIDLIIVRKFIILEIIFMNVLYKDLGKYVCIVGFYFCGGLGFLRKFISLVSLNLNGKKGVL